MTTAPINAADAIAGTRMFDHLMNGVRVDDLAITGHEDWLPPGAHPVLETQLTSLQATLDRGRDDRLVAAWLADHDGPLDQRERLAAINIAHHTTIKTSAGIRIELAPLEAPKKRVLLPIELAAVRRASLANDAKAASIGALEAGLAQAEMVLAMTTGVLDDGARLEVRGQARTLSRVVPIPGWARPPIRRHAACGQLGLFYNGTRPSLKAQTASINMNLTAILKAAGCGYDPTVTAQSVPNTTMSALLATEGLMAVREHLGRTKTQDLQQRLEKADWQRPATT